MIRARRGFTLTELVIAMSLALGFALLVSSALVSTSTLAGRSVVRASLAQDARGLADLATRYLQGAAPPGTCLDPNQSWPLASCRKVGEQPAAFSTASASTAVFYSYASSAATGSRCAGALTDTARQAECILTVPDKIKITSTGTELKVVRYAALPGSTYTSPAWASEPGVGAAETGEVLRILRVSGTPDVLAYYDSAGNRLGAGSGQLGAEERAEIALVMMTPRLETVIGGETRTSGVDIAVPIGSARQTSGLR